MTVFTIYFRIVAYLVTIFLHIGNAIWMSSNFYGEVMKNPHVKHFAEMQCYFFTCWNFVFQIMYATIALHTDILTLKNLKNRGYQLPTILTKFRDKFYSTIVWPATMLVFTVFWSFFVYDRNLLYPKDIDLAISPISNHIMHTSIIFFVLWEMMLRPRTPPRSHIKSVCIILVVEIVYYSTVYGMYMYKGVYIYPIFRHLIGTIYFYMFFLALGTVLIFLYHAQWVLNDFLWGSEVRRLYKEAESSEKNVEYARRNGENSAKKVI